MAEFAYTTVPGKIKELLDKIRTTGIPAKVTNQWLEVVGLKSSNDRSLLPVLRQIQFTDASGVPTERWKHYRSNGHKSALAEAVKAGYSDLFHIYPDAWQRPDTDVENFFLTRSTAGKQAIDKTVSTFKALITLADFVASHEVPTEGPPTPHTPPTGGSLPLKAPPAAPAPVGPTLHIDIQIHIASDATPEQIDQIFSSMGKHLYKNNPEA
jgi:hypothetical protein